MDLMTYKCPNCGAAIVFSSEKQCFWCESCESTFTQEELEKNAVTQTEENVAGWSQPSEGTTVDGTNVYVCSFCGAEIVTDSETAATACPYCDNPVILSNNVSGMNKPDYIIPFKVSKDDAEKALSEFYNGKRLLPDSFTANNRIKEIKGVYVPFWLFDCTGKANGIYKATKVRQNSDKDYNYRITEHYDLFRTGTMRFENIPADASSKMADEYMDAIEPFDFSQLQPFNTGFLSGYLADKYDVDMDKCSERANCRVENTMFSELEKSVGNYDTVNISSKQFKVVNGVAKYSLMPVWMLNTKFEDKIYTFAMNGQTGRMVGELPVDKKKYHKWLFGAAAAAFAIGQIFVFLL